MKRENLTFRPSVKNAGIITALKKLAAKEKSWNSFLEKIFVAFLKRHKPPHERIISDTAKSLKKRKRKLNQKV